MYKNGDGQAIPAEIVIFCDTDALFFKAVVKHFSPEVDRKLAEELEYLNYHHTRKTKTGLIINYSRFEFYSESDTRLCSIIRFDTLEDAAKVLFSEPYKERGAVLLSPFSLETRSFTSNIRSASSEITRSKALIRTSMGFNCVAVLFNELPPPYSQDKEYRDWADGVMDFSDSGITENHMRLRITGSAEAMLNAEPGRHSLQKDRSPTTQLQSMLNFFLWSLPTSSKSENLAMGVERPCKLFVARFYCFNHEEGGSRIAPTDFLTFWVAGMTTVQGHLVNIPGSNIEPGKLCDENVLVIMAKTVCLEPRDGFVVRKADGVNIGVGIIISCT